jgi:tetratricopeptide (TPR) repeat protein
VNSTGRRPHEQALAIRTALRNPRGVGDSLINLGEVELARGDLPAALDYTRRALEIYEQLGLKRHQANAHVQFSRILRGLGRLDEAMGHLRAGLPIAESLNSHLLTADYQRELALLHEALGDMRAALEAQRRLAAETEAALGEKSRLQISVLRARYDVEHAELELARLRAQQAGQEAEIRATTAAAERGRRYRDLALLLIAVAALAIGAFGFLRRRGGRPDPGSSAMDADR